MAVYIFWGSTATAMRIGVASLPPFALASIRFTIAGAMLWTWCRARGAALPTRTEWRDAALTGAVMLVLSNGLFVWVLQYLPSGIGALFFALSPLWMATIGFAFFGERLAPLGVAGLVLGLLGMAYLYLPVGSQHLPVLPTIVGVTCSITWAIGAFVQRRLRGADVVQVSAMQMLAAAAILAAIGFATGEHLSLAQFTPPAIGALAYLVVCGSLVGFSAYLWLLNNVPIALTATYAYVNPIVAITIGIVLLHETFSWPLAIGSGAIVVGVALMAWASARPSRSVLAVR